MNAFTRKEIAAELGVHYQTFVYWLNSGKVPGPDMACGKQRFYSPQQAKRVYAWYVATAEEEAKQAKAAAERLRKLAT